MAFTSGSCANGQELQTKIKDYLTTNGWTSLKDTGLVGNSREMLFANPDATVNIGFLSTQNTSILSYYLNIQLNVFDSYNSSLTFYNQSGSLTSTTNYPLITSSFEPTKYWFFLNNRRIIIVTYAEESYSVAYLGKFIPHGSPEQYAKPFFCGGTGYRLTDNLRSAGVFSQYRNFYELCNAVAASTQFQVKNHLNTWKISTWRSSNYITGLYPTPYSYYYYNVTNNVIKAQPVAVIDGEYTLGILDGFYSVERIGLSAESTVVIKNELGVDENYIAFPNSNKGDSNYKTYYLIKLL